VLRKHLARDEATEQREGRAQTRERGFVDQLAQLRVDELGHVAVVFVDDLEVGLVRHDLPDDLAQHPRHLHENHPRLLHNGF